MNKLNVSVSPHIRSGVTTTGIMLDVIIALLPAFAASIWLFGARSLYITAICVLSCVLGELAFELITKRELTIGDLSAVVTGMLLAFNLPVGIPEWQAVIGSLVAIVVVKQLFGGIGYNFANPALTARVVMLLSFAESMVFVSPRGADLTSSATPLALISQQKYDELPSIFRMLMGQRSGSLGETCAIALIAGFAYLLCRRVITWHTPVMFVERYSCSRCSRPALILLTPYIRCSAADFCWAQYSWRRITAQRRPQSGAKSFSASAADLSPLPYAASAAIPRAFPLPYCL